MTENKRVIRYTVEHKKNDSCMLRRIYTKKTKEELNALKAEVRGGDIHNVMDITPVPCG